MHSRHRLIARRLTFFLTRSPQEQDKGPGEQSSPEDITKAKEAVADALKAIRETS